MTRPLVAILRAPSRDLAGFADAEELATIEHAGELADVERLLARVDAIFAWGGGRRELLDLVPRAPRLRWIQSSSAGVEDLASPVLHGHDVVLTNAAGVFDAALAEAVLGFLLALSGRILEDARMQPGAWPQDPSASDPGALP